MTLRTTVKERLGRSGLGRNLAPRVLDLRDRARDVVRPAMSSVLVAGPADTSRRTEVGAFRTSAGDDLALLDGYRYAQKACWRIFPALNDLDRLDHEGLLRDPEKRLVQEAIGTRTLGVAPDELDATLRAVARRIPDRFTTPTTEAELPRALPTLEETDRRVDAIALLRARQLRSIGFRSAATRPRVLEIGYTSGGHSLAAFERLGFDVVGIDNFYDGVGAGSPLPGHILRTLLHSAAALEIGDICRDDTLDGERFDLVFSESVVEHLSDVEAAFRQIGRLVGHGGVTLHSYQPYFCEAGGHSYGILDQPFGHVRLPREDVLRYLSELRPLEAPAAVPWVDQALNRRSQGEIQHDVTNAGLRIRSWNTRRAPSLPDGAVVDACFATHPHITLDDLVTDDVLLAAGPA